MTRDTMTRKELLSAYQAGQRVFHHVRLDNVNLSGANLTGASFYEASLKSANFDHANLIHVQFKSADLTGASLSGASIGASDLIGASFVDADLSHADLTGACLASADFTRADMRLAWFNNCTLQEAIFTGTNLTGAKLSDVHFNDVDIGAFCDAKDLQHIGPSSIDSRTVMKSYQCPNLKDFMIACGVPGIFAEYMIDCARVLGEPLLRSLLQSTFISYGGPDEPFARKLYDALRAHQVVAFFFPETAKVGERIETEVFRGIQKHDRVLLICSRHSLNRTGVIHEIQETLDREARDGGATYLLPIMLDDYVLTGWRETHPQLAERIGRRIIGDFRKTQRNKKAFAAAIARVVDALKIKRPE